MKKLRRVTKDVDPENGDVRYLRSRGKKKVTDPPPEEKRWRNKGFKAYRKRWRAENLKPASQTPEPTPKLNCGDPAWMLLKRQVLEEEPRCRYCGSRKNPTVDHIVPRSLGGGYHRSNLQRLCEDCNQRKGIDMVVPNYATRPPRAEA